MARGLESRGVGARKDRNRAGGIRRPGGEGPAHANRDRDGRNFARSEQPYIHDRNMSSMRKYMR